MNREKFFKRGPKPQRVIVVGIKHGKMTRRQMESSLGELVRLVETAGGNVVSMLHQDVKRVDPSTFVGEGKVAEIAELIAKVEADLVAIDYDISPVQNKNLEEALGVFVLDRTAIILDIFAMRAKSREGKLQVELAQLEYLAPRLVGRGKMLSQQVGRIGTRGPGETALEYDRRTIRDRITRLRRSIEGVSAHRQIHRMKRDAVSIPLVSLVGYTNAGKSTLMNALTGANVFVEDKLFATLDPTVRRLRLPSGREVLLADTVGFIRRLPHELVDSFKSTFEEVVFSHLLIHVIDGADPEAHEHSDVVDGVLSDLGLLFKPRLAVLNKCDVAGACDVPGRDAIRVSAKTGEGLSELLSRMDAVLRLEFRRTVLRLPVDRGDIVSNLYRQGFIWKILYEGDAVLVDCELHQKFYGKYRQYEVHDAEAV